MKDMVLETLRWNCLWWLCVAKGGAPESLNKMWPVWLLGAKLVVCFKTLDANAFEVCMFKTLEANAFEVCVFQGI